MMRTTVHAAWACLGILASWSPALSCSLCSANLLQSPTLRQDAAQAKMVLYGTLTAARLVSGGDAFVPRGETDFEVQTILKGASLLGGKKTLRLPRYVPVDPQNLPQYVVFCDVYKSRDGEEKIDPFRGIPVPSRAIVEYLGKATAFGPEQRTQALRFFFDNLDHDDGVIANDAYAELVKAGDQDIGQAAREFTPVKIRSWLRDARTPANRLGLYAFFLGACGDDRDASYLHSELVNRTERTLGAFDGFLGGYIQLRPREGWGLALKILSDEKKPFPERYSVLRTFRFFHGWKPKETLGEVLGGYKLALAQGDVADIAIEDLRLWKSWELTAEVLSLYGKPTHQAPIVQRTIVRYALCCPERESARFVDAVRRGNPELVQDVQESLQFEK